MTVSQELKTLGLLLTAVFTAPVIFNDPAIQNMFSQDQIKNLHKPIYQ